MSDEGMSDAEFDAKVGFPVGERYVPKSKLDAAEARATAAERERDALAKELGTTKRAFARSIGENPDVMAALQSGIVEGLATGKSERDALREALRRYGQCSYSCASNVILTSLPPKRQPCDCGYRAALTANHSAPQEQQP